MPHRSWVKISLRLPIQYHDLITGQLNTLGFEGFQQEETALLCFMRQSRWNHPLELKLKYLLSRFKKEFPACDPIFSKQIIREQNWNARWERTAGIVDVTPRMIIKPSWCSLRKKDKGKIIIHIDPKMSFGTGHHESTRLSLYLLEEYVHPGVRILDVGCGSGVLSIAAAKLGARAVIGIDNDDWAITNAKENVTKNRTGAKVGIFKRRGKLLPAKRFDLIFSNIDLPTNLKSLRAYHKHLAPGGAIIFSGMLSSDLSKLLPLIQKERLTPVEILEENEWVALAVIDNNAH